MAEYKIIDEIGSTGKTETKPWNPTAVFLFTVIAGPIVGGCMGIMNYGRLGIKGHKRTAALLLVIAAITFPLLPVLGFETFGKGLITDISEEIAIGLKFVLGFYLLGTQKDHFDRHIGLGGNGADLLMPVCFAVLFMISVPGFDISMLMGAGNQSRDPVKGSSTTEQYEKPGVMTLRKNITVYAGSPPYIDGITDVKDGWEEGEKITTRARDKTYNITTKHDLESIFILIEWEGTPEWLDRMEIYFEQDDGEPDLNLSNGRVDNYYQGALKYGPDSFRDAHFNNKGYNVEETQNGKLKTGYNDGRWSEEWQLPLKSGDPFDICVDKYPAVLGFSIINSGNAKYGVFPVNAWFLRPESWGIMTIVDTKRQ